MVSLLIYLTLVSPISSDKSATDEFSNTQYVGGSGPGNYTTIQEGIDAATSGDTVYVYNGTYYESVIVNKSINLVGEQKEATFIDGGYVNPVLLFESFDEDDGGFTIVDGDGNPANWQFGNTIPAGCVSGGASGSWFFIDDDAAGEEADPSTNNSLISPFLDATAYSSLELQFTGDFRSLISRSDCLTVSVYDGMTWHEIITYDDTIDGFDAHSSLPLDISVASGHENVQVKFTYDDGEEWAYGALIDDVYVYGSASKSDFMERGREEVAFYCGFEQWLNDIPVPFENNNGWMDSYYGTPHSGTQWGYSWTAGDTLTTPVIEPLLDPVLEFWKCAEIGEHPMDLEVYCNGDLVYGEYGYNHTDYQKETVLLDQFEDTEIVIEIVAETSSYYGQCIDDVKITGLEPWTHTEVVTINADNVSLNGFTIQNSGIGFMDTGLDIESDNNTIFNNIFNNNGYGFYLSSSSYNSIYENAIMNSSWTGLCLISSSHNSIYENAIMNSYAEGLSISNPSSHHNHVYSNYVISNQFGIELDNADENLIYNNYLNNSDTNGQDNGNNHWNISKTSGTNIIGGSYLGGNYWSDYMGNDTDGDGLGDTNVPFGPGDFLPLVPGMIICDVNQSLFDRGFPIRHAVDGDWAAAQSFTPTVGMISKVCLYARVFGTPEFDLTVELREDNPQGTLVDSVSFTPGEVPGSWSWLDVDFANVTVELGTDYFIVCPPAPSGVTTSFGYEWAYAFGNQYDDGSFWFTRDGGGLWRDLPTRYEFTFRTFGYNL